MKPLLRSSACTLALASTLMGPYCLAQTPPGGDSPTPPLKNATTVAPVSAETRLEILRNAILDKALEGPNRIRSFAWVDETGVLRENLQISSDLKLRGIRVQSYLATGDPKETRLLADAEETLTRMGARGCAEPGRIKRHASLSSVYSTEKGRLGFGAFGEIAELTESRLLSQFSQDNAWVVTRAANPASGYERLLVSRDSPMERPYSMRLSFEVMSDESNLPSPLDYRVMQALGMESPRIPGRQIRISMKVEEHTQGRTLWQGQAVVAYPSTAASLERRSLPASVIDSIERTARNWQTSIQKATACESMPLSAKTEDGELVSIVGGSRIGLRAGDQLLLVDGARFPNNVLEAATLAGAALIEIQEVARDSSIARRIAGQKQSVQPAKMFALPL